MKLHLSSIKLFFVLIVLIVGISIYGSTIPPEEITPSPSGTLSQQNDVFHAWYFTLILILLSLNVAACTIKRLKAGYKLRPSVVLHLGIIIILIGAAIGAVFGVKGELKIYEGEMKYSFVSRKNDVVPLGFGIALDDFILERYSASDGEAVIARIENDPSEYSFPIATGKRHQVGNSGYYIEMLKYLPDFVIDVEGKEADTRSQEPNNPALLIKVDGPNGAEERWVFAKFPNFTTGNDKSIMLHYHSAPSSVKEFKSKLRIIEDNETVAEKTIEVNDPLRYKGYAFYQSSYDSQEMRWSGLQVVNDPGVGAVYFGFAILIIGTSWALGKKIVR